MKPRYWLMMAKHLGATNDSVYRWIDHKRFAGSQRWTTVEVQISEVDDFSAGRRGFGRQARARRKGGGAMNLGHEGTTWLIEVGGGYETAGTIFCSRSDSEGTVIGYELRTMPSGGTGRGLAQ